MSVYLGIDIGTTSTKCLAVGEEGSVLAFAQHPYVLSHPKQGWAEQDPEDFWTALIDVVRRCVTDLESQGRSSGDVVSLALSTQGDTLLMVDETGSPLAPSISWMDGRADEEYAELLAETGSSYWYRTIGQPLTHLSSACKVRWLAKNRPELLGPNSRPAWVADFLAKRLIGEFAADVSSASWTPFFSPTRREWSREVADLLGIRSDDLPVTAESGSVLGELLPESAEALGLGAGTVLVAGAFDQSAAAHGAGASVGGKSVLSCGTAWVLYSVSSRPIDDPEERLCVCCHVGGESGNGAPEWGLVLPFTGGSAYDWLARTTGESDGAASDSDPPIFIPHLYGGLSPDWRSESRGSLLGLTMAHTREDIRLAMMRGIACEARRNLEAAEPLVGRVESVRMVGGAGKSEVWPRIIADVLGRRVEVSGLLESACLGVARLAAGQVSSTWSDTVALRLYVPTPEGIAAEARFYDRYVAVYEALLRVYGA